MQRPKMYAWDLETFQPPPPPQKNQPPWKSKTTHFAFFMQQIQLLSTSVWPDHHVVVNIKTHVNDCYMDSYKGEAWAMISTTSY